MKKGNRIPFDLILNPQIDPYENTTVNTFIEPCF